ncbi:Lanosterol 14-alpha-demethylase, partial [Linnemannia gamsii]
MTEILSANSRLIPIDALKIVVPLGIGLASAAYLAVKMASNSYDKSIPNVPIRKGDSTHDKELYENHNEFLLRCEEKYGPIFTVKALNWNITVISGPMAREVFINESFSPLEALDALTGVQTFGRAILKSNTDDVNRPILHDLVRDTVTRDLLLFTPRIVEQLERVVDEKLGYCEGKAVEKPIKIFEDMIAYAMANIIMGPEVAQHRTVIDSLIQSNRTKYGILNPLHKHVKVLTDAAGPVIEERRRQEAVAYENGVEWDRPLDVMQKLLDNSEKYGFVDLEDICGHLMLMVLASIHSTTERSTNLVYYLAYFPEYHEPLFQEQQEVLGQISAEREDLRQKKLQSGEFKSAEEFVGIELDPAHDRDLSAAA